MIDTISESVATVGEAVFDLSYRFFWGLPSATVRPLSLPHRFSFMRFIARSASFFWDCVNVLGSSGS
jgi:hypothetical protein